jgi:hypothetical protein
MIGTDKWLHFGVSFLLALIDPCLAVIAGIAKETADLFGAGMADFGDLVANGLGSLGALLLTG